MYISGKVCVYIYPTVYIYLGLNCISNFFPHSQRSHLQGIFPEDESEVIVQAHKPPLTTGNQLLLICLPLVGTEVSSKSSVARGEDSLQLPRSIYDLHLVKFTAQTKNGLHALNAAVNYKRGWRRDDWKQWDQTAGSAVRRSSRKDARGANPAETNNRARQNIASLSDKVDQ